MKENHDQTVDEFVGRLGLIAQADGLPRIAGQIMGLLVIYGGPFSFAELAKRLQVSRGSISTNSRLLENLGVIERVVRIEMNDRQARLKKAEAWVREQERANKGANVLGEKGYQSQRLLDETYSALQSTQAELEEIRLEIESRVIRAPFDGILEARRVELGDYVAVNGEVATIVDNDPLFVSVQVAQQDIGKIALGDVATVAFATEQTGEGRVRFIAPRAEEATRTFRVELEVSNPENRIFSGTSAEVRLPTGAVPAHFVSPAMLTLNDAG